MNIPKGWQLVPVEPTPEMLSAADTADREYTDRNFGDVITVQQGPYEHYVAMLAAAPTPPVRLENTSPERVKNQAETEHKPAAWAWRYEDGALDLSGMSRTQEACGYAFTGCTGQPVPLYLHPPTLLMPEPMTFQEFGALPSAKGPWPYTAAQRAALLCREVEAEVLRRVKEANK